MLEARTVYYCAAVSLLTASTVAVSPTELEEIERRAKLLSMGEELFRSSDRFLNIEMKDWGFATSKGELDTYVDSVVDELPIDDNADCYKTLEYLTKKVPEFRLDRALKILSEEQALPF